MKLFTEKVVVITGAGSGIGRSLAVAFSKLGAILALNDLSMERLEETKLMLEPNTKVFLKNFDISIKNEIEDFKNDIINKFGGVNIVINNAGVALSKYNFLELKEEDENWLMKINLWAVYNSSKIFLPYLREQKESYLVNLSSVFGLHGIPFQIPYAIAKAGVKALNQSLYAEEKYLNSSVFVVSVHPGGIKTRIAKDSRGADANPKLTKKFERNFITTPEKAAKTIINGIKNRNSKVLIGIDAYAIDLLSRFIPGLLMKLIIKSMKKFE
ncbi:MAG: SDR family NAD(P)-dependent oxidoreductase [Solirubrobacteraceae bacterium]